MIFALFAVCIFAALVLEQVKLSTYLGKPESNEDGFVWVPMIIAAAAGLAAAGVGAAVSAADRKQARRYRQRASDMYAGMAPATYEDLQGQLEVLRQEGMIDPKGHMAILELDADGRSKAGDPDARLAQKEALNHLKSIMANDGMPAQDRAYYYKIADNLQRQVAASQKAAAAQQRQQGLGGGGGELMAALASSQGAYKAAGEGSLDLAGMAAQRKDQAAGAVGQLGGQMQSQAFQEGATVAGLSMERRAEALRNVLAQQGMRNDAFAQRMGINAGQANALAGQANAADQNAQRTANTWATVGQGIAQAGAGATQYGIQQQYIDKMPAQTASASYIPPSVYGADNTGLDDFEG